VPSVILIAGPNGAGKTTFGDEYLSADERGFEFVNADEIARGLAARDELPRSEVLAARAMLRRVDELVGARGSVLGRRNLGWKARMSQGLDREKAEAALKRAAHRAVHGTLEERSGRVISSALTHVSYSAATGELDIRFVSGRTYRYSNVPPEVYERLISAPSKGAFYNARIRDEYACRALVP
jgi:cytidylate kinase